MENVKTFSKFLLSLGLRVLIAILVGTLLLSAVYLLPTAPMEKHLFLSASVLEEEGTYPSLFSWCGSTLDNFTDSIMLLNAVYDSGESVAVQAMTAARGEIIALRDPCKTLVAHYGHGEAFDAEEPYYQYWHGYLVLLKPLLLLTTYQGIRILNAVLQTAMLAVLLVLLVKKGLKQYVIPYLASVLFLMPVTLAMSLQFSSCYYILTAGSIALLLLKDKLEEKEALIFLYIGVATAYFDFLTYPIATLCLPAILYCCIRGRMEWKETLGKGVKFCFSWGFGYLFMWAGKWIVGSILTGYNVLLKASDKVIERSSSEAVQSGSLVENIIDTLYANLTSFLHTPATVLLAAVVLILLVLAVMALDRKKPSFRMIVSCLFPFVILACLPVVWYVATTNHSSIHHWFTCKSLTASVFAALSALVNLRQNTVES